MNTQEQKQETDKLVEEIQLRITENFFTFDEAEEVSELWSNSGYTLHFLHSTKDYSSNQLNIINDTYFIYDIEFFDVSGSVLIISNVVRTRYMAYFIGSITLSVILFLILILREMAKLISKIKVIERGINIIANDDLQHKIEIVGEKEILSLAKNINNMGETIYIKSQNEHKEEISKRMLITNLSHDVRTPLTSISGYLELILASTEKDSTINNYASTAKKNSLRLQKLIEDLFLYSKLISNDLKLQIEEYSMSRLLLQIVELYEEEISVDIQSKNVMILVDLNHFQRVISNLLDNAQKYKNKDTDICIKNYSDDRFTYIEIQNETNDDLTDKIGLLTNRLYKVEENRKDSSSGLGLSIVVELLKTFDSSLYLLFEDHIFTAQIKIPRKE